MEVRDRLAKEEMGHVEVKCEHGRLDVLTADSIIEVKHSSKYLHALGQVLGYGESFPGLKKRIHLFSAVRDDENVAKAKKLCSRHDVTVTSETLR